MSEQLPPTHSTREWSNPQSRDEFERYLGTSLGTYAHEFDGSHYSHLLGADTVGEGVVKQMAKQYGSEDPGFRVIYHANFDNPDGTFSGGFLFFGASSRELAEQAQGHFTQEMNYTLENLDAGFRLADPNQH